MKEEEQPTSKDQRCINMAKYKLKCLFHLLIPFGPSIIVHLLHIPAVAAWGKPKEESSSISLLCACDLFIPPARRQKKKMET